MATGTAYPQMMSSKRGAWLGITPRFTSNTAESRQMTAPEIREAQAYFCSSQMAPAMVTQVMLNNSQVFPGPIIDVIKQSPILILSK